MSRPVLGLVLVVVLTFAAGFATGTTFLRHESSSATPTYLEDLSSRYHLSPSQIDGVRALLSEERKAIDAILAKVGQQVKDEIQATRLSTQGSIRSLLDDNQRAAFDKDRTGG